MNNIVIYLKNIIISMHINIKVGYDIYIRYPTCNVLV